MQSMYNKGMKMMERTRNLSNELNDCFVQWNFKYVYVNFAFALYSYTGQTVYTWISHLVIYIFLHLCYFLCKHIYIQILLLHNIVD